MIKGVVALVFLAANLYVYHWFAATQVIPERIPFSAFPRSFDAWRCEQPFEMDEKTLQNLGASDYFACLFTREDAVAGVDLYVGYHETQIREEGGGAGENSIHPPKHCLPGSGWDIIAHDVVVMDVDGLPQQPARVNRLVIAKGEARQLVYYWYQTQGRVIAEDWRKIVFLSWDRLRRHRTDGALVRFTTPFNPKSEQAADDRVLELAHHVVPVLGAYVPE